MSAATKLSEQSFSEARNQRIFEAMMEAFFKRWAPDDKYEMAQFHAELASLIRRVYIDAQEPLTKQLTAVLSTMPMTPMVVPKDRG